jgi:sterol desaturase/sphingolipid hydroxylase (fatty acid hydroxylase superfamily)
MRFHRVHHAPHLSVMVAFRMHPLETLAYMLLGNLPLVILGMPAWGGIYVLLAERTYNVLLHARVPFRLGVLGKVFASGEFHHRHHAPGKAANFGGVVSIFDHLFGTAAPRPRACLQTRTSSFFEDRHEFENVIYGFGATSRTHRH